MSKAQKMLELFGFGSEELNDNNLRMLARKHNVDIKAWNLANKKLVINADYIDKSNNGVTDRFISDIQKKKWASNVIVADPRGNFYRKYIVPIGTGDSAHHKFETGTNVDYVLPGVYKPAQKSKYV